MAEIKLSDAINRLCEEIKKDESYRITWEANIAMAFKDAYNFSGHIHNRKVVHDIANRAAAAFLDQLIGKDIGNVDGKNAVYELHKQAKPLM